MSQQPVRWITTLWLLLDAQLGKFQLASFYPCDVSRRGVLFHRDRLKGGQRFDLLKTFPQDFGVDAETICKQLREGGKVLICHLFSGENHVVDWPRVDERNSIAIKN